jgi:hypothetical protein
VCAPEEKDMRRDKVWSIAHGMVVLNLPDELAWTISVDWNDFEFIGIPHRQYTILIGLEMYGESFIKDLIGTIPQSGLAKVFMAYLSSGLSTFPSHSPDETSEQDVGTDEIKISPDEILEDMIVQSEQDATDSEGSIQYEYILYHYGENISILLSVQQGI